jgi:predicted anti-sigma-YlaC factor YlaD
MGEEAGMNCSDHQRIINRFIDHEVRAAECAELFEHLGACGECRQFYDSIITLSVELDKVHPSIDEMAGAPWQQGVAAIRQSMSRIPDQKGIAPRPSTLAFVIVVMLVVSLLFSVNVAIEKPAQTMPTAAADQR